jgi:hypothetical protein
MNGESSLPSGFDGDSELCGVLQEVVVQIRAVPPPPGLAARLIERAATWSIGNQVAPSGVADRSRPLSARATWGHAVAVAAVLGLVAIAVGALVYWIDWSAPDPSPVVVLFTTANKSPTGGTAKEVPQVKAKDDGAASGGGIVPGGKSGASPCPFHAVAGDATILVSTGPAKPIGLGDTLPFVANGTMHVWDWSKGTESRPLKVTSGKAMAVAPDGKWIVTRDGQLIDAATSEVKRLDNFDGDVHGLRFSPDGRVLLLTINRANDVATARVLDFPSGKKRFEIEGQWSYTFACAFTPDGSQFFLMDKDKFVHRWDAKTGKDLGRYEPALSNSIRAIAVSPDAKQVVAAGTRGDIYLWELAGGKLIHQLMAEQPDLTVLTGIDSLAFSPDGKVLAGGSFVRLVLWETASGKIARLLPSASHGAGHIRFSKDGKTLTTVHDFYGTSSKQGEDLLVYPSVRAWDVDNGKELKSKN